MDDDLDRHLPPVTADVLHNSYVVLVDELPRNPSGKILKRELRDTYAGLAGDAP